MTALTDRYVWAVLRGVPAAQRADLEPEVRALVADAIEARTGEPAPSGASAEAAERAALTELGDPDCSQPSIRPPQYPSRTQSLPRVEAAAYLAVPIAFRSCRSSSWRDLFGRPRRPGIASASGPGSPSRHMLSVHSGVRDR